MPGLLDLIAARNPEQAGGLLSDLVAAPRNRLRGLLDNPIGFANDALQEGLFGPPEVRAARDKFWNKEPMTDLEKQAYTNQLLNMGMAGLTVYHGSPHKFDKFDMSKIGTGEGAQAYGHGLYFAENPQVAMDYQRKLAGADNGVAGQIAANAMRGRTPEAAIEHLSSGLRGTPESQKVTQEAIYLIKSGNANTGKLYKVDLPDEAVARMLDWDKPLSQQAPEVRAALESHQAYPAIKAWLNAHLSNAPKGTEATGQAINEVLAGKLGGQQAVSNLLKSQGIPGIRYLDGGSRNAGQGTYNYVVFDDALPTILERNGQKLK